MFLFLLIIHWMVRNGDINRTRCIIKHKKGDFQWKSAYETACAQWLQIGASLNIVPFSPA
jgi:hypothetical protein